jgi:hypothetical protein
MMAAFLASVATVCGLLVIYGPQMRAAADAHEATTVETENSAFCTRFGMGPGAARFAECAAALQQIRTRYIERRTAESIL